MIFWICGSFAIAAATFATFVSDVRRAALALWVAGLAVGGVYLALGAELLAITQWVISTVVAIAFVFYAVMFGEYSGTQSGPPIRRLVGAIAPVLAGAALTAAVIFGAGGMKGWLDPTRDAQDSGNQQQDLNAIGLAIADDHLLALEILGVTLFLALVGGGVVARPRKDQEDEGS